MITINSLTKKYGDTTVVHDISFTARSGRVTGFLGPNGAGKSTTLRMMSASPRPPRARPASPVANSPTYPTPGARSA
jgi:ABC-2 type transport system ATP-binding protein